MAKVTAPEAPATAAFELDDEQEALLHPKKGRAAAEPPYLVEVQAAVDNGGSKALGIKVPENVKGSKIVNDVAKSAKYLGVKLKIQNREDKGGFVAFTFVPPTPEPETTAIPVVPAAAE